MSTTLVHPETAWVGLDVHKDSITSAVLRPGRDLPDVDRWFHDEPSVRRFVAGLGDRALVRACYEAGPTGYDLARLLASLGVRCEVIAPSLIPTMPGARVKTDARDARRLAQLYRAGELTAVRIPTVAEEGLRDLCRTRADLVTDRTRARHRLGKFLLRHGQVWRGGRNWTHRHEAWLGQVCFDDTAMDTTYRHYRAVLATVDANLEAVESDLARYYLDGPFADAVARLGAYRGITELGALTLASEVGDWRRFGRATAAMGFCGLVPSEYSSGRAPQPGPDNQGRQHPPAGPAGRERLGLPAPARHGRGDAPPPGALWPRDGGPGLGCPAPPLRQVRSPLGPQELPQRRGRGRGPGARGLAGPR